MPNLFIIAGPNGAGKSTSAPGLLSGVRRVAEFVKADVIQKEEGISEIQAGRRTLERTSRCGAGHGVRNHASKHAAIAAYTPNAGVGLSVPPFLLLAAERRHGGEAGRGACCE